MGSLGFCSFYGWIGDDAKQRRNVRQDGNKIIFSLKDNSRFIVAYERKISFDQHSDEDVTVYDWFDINSGSKIDLEEIVDNEDDLVKK